MSTDMALVGPEVLSSVDCGLLGQVCVGHVGFMLGGEVEGLGGWFPEIPA